jgi:hypothetical protein
MQPTDPQFIYMVLILPSLFGVTMVGEGVAKVVHYNAAGWIHIILGVLFVLTIGGAYVWMSGWM